MSFHAVVALVLAAAFGAGGCATARKENAEQPAARAQAGTQNTGAVDTAAPAASAADDVAEVDRNDLQALSRVEVKLPFADVQLVGNSAARRSHLKIKRIAGSEACRVRVVVENNQLRISEGASAVKPSGLSGVGKGKSALPPVPACKFAVELASKETPESAVELVRGSVQAEQWKQALSIRVDWGDIDVGSVGPLKVTCGRCTLTGEEIAGPLNYELQSGNVGLAGLVGSVEGATLGDTVLKWRKLAAGSKVKLLSRAGDVILTFPGATPLAIDLKAPRGEVHTKVGHGESGVPVDVVAELGNVQVYRSPGGK